MNIRKILIKRAIKKSRQNEDISRNTNILRTLLNVSQDTAKLMSLQLLFIKAILNQLKFPLNLLNLGLQITVVLFDKNYSKKLKFVTFIALLFVLLLTCAIWSLAPAVTTMLIILTISAHLTMLFYRANKFNLSLSNYQKGNQLNPTTSSDALFIELLSQYQQVKKLVMGHEDQELMINSERKLEMSLDQYCQLTEKKPTKHAKLLNLINSGSGVAIIILRGIVAVALLTIATSMPPLVLPILLITFFCNLSDFIRSLHTKYEAFSTSKNKLHHKINIINQLDTLSEEFEFTNDYETIISSLHQRTSITPRNIQGDEIELSDIFSKQTSKDFFKPLKHQPSYLPSQAIPQF
ncbi:hypothetical protein [Legionella gresilensis]|uniref:hypothetical protein n=1 Tax=Legionella gresilensis TaxID=91823 RepID=UPI0010419692|nr:hypothetical protein [Legionella gresilensis]